MADTHTNEIIHSINPVGDTAFPFLTLEIESRECFPPNLGFKVMHWHEEVQFILVLKGIVHIQTVNHSCDLKAGEAIFINKGVLHQITEKLDCHYRSFIFPEYFFTFYSGSSMAENNVLPLTNSPSLPLIIFKSTELWQTLVLTMLSELNQLVNSKDNIKFYEYQLSIRLVNIWFTIISNIEIPSLELSKINNSKQERMQTFLSFINTHFEKNISLNDISKSAHVSRAECNRCFKSILQTTPYKYLLGYRLNKSIELLKTTDYSITEIACMIGFNHTSHYIKYFKQKMMMTPLEFRRALSSSSSK
ncbi:AraC family transcriptional regulator [Metaclostridioides mangenotii]|uniref:AraC family transcriptional regulator n=1 Tax=Metaclostridioides mangenotii TaxID=1540 RepID=UPI00068CB2C3|nr:AraC family transcriptional regulator [Clostridioides mangenotii]